MSQIAFCVAYSKYLSLELNVKVGVLAWAFYGLAAFPACRKLSAVQNAWHHGVVSRAKHPFNDVGMTSLIFHR